MTDRGFHIITFGCQMNVHDSQWLARALTARGLVESTLEEARVIVVNTCSVREKPEQKVMSTLGRIRQLRAGESHLLVAVTGCVAQQLGAEFFEREPLVRLVAGSDGIASAPAAIERLLEEPDLRLSLLDFSSHYIEREAGVEGPCGPMAHVNIMQGCDNFCAYCIVPFTRGRQKSRLSAAILAECRQRLAQGAREICLLGQNVNAFGRDSHGDGLSFARLLRQVAALPGLERLRFVTPHPKDMAAEDVAAFADVPQLCPRLHLPLQAGSDAVLRRMGRRYDSADFLRLVEALRAARPDLALSTDLIVGFPGESEADFQATLIWCGPVTSCPPFPFAIPTDPAHGPRAFWTKSHPKSSRIGCCVCKPCRTSWARPGWRPAWGAQPPSCWRAKAPNPAPPALTDQG